MDTVYYDTSKMEEDLEMNNRVRELYVPTPSTKASASLETPPYPHPKH